ncbi:hypothetical protein [Streptomyces sp. NPDC086519]|uniref:hypothetical protein n=1 Tax=Streptomyces sp. NPDC086519 TaxID=3154863 RepID=UPI0034186733
MSRTGAAHCRNGSCPCGGRVLGRFPKPGEYPEMVVEFVRRAHTGGQVWLAGEVEPS